MKSKKWIGEGLKPNSVNCNVLNVLRTLIENEETTVYIPNGYKQGTAPAVSTDPRVHFFPTESGKKIEVVGISSNKERFNFSLLGLVPVLVEYDSNGEVELKPKKVWRQYNIIRDSELMFDYIIAKLNTESFNDLRDAGLLYYNGVKVPKCHKHNENFLYKVMLKDIPLISVNWAQPVNIGLYEMMREEIEITQKQKLLKAKIAELKSVMQYTDLVEEGDIYIEAPSSYERVYTGESYTVDCIVYSLPEIEKMSLVNEEYSDQFKTLEDAFNEKITLDNRLKNIRFMSRCVIMAIENSKKQGSYEWSDSMLVPRSKNKYRQEAIVETKNGFVKLRRETSKKTIKL